MKTLHALIVAVAVTGCASHRSLNSTELTPRTELRVRFATPRALTFKSGEIAVLLLDDVVELRGQMILTSHDSVRVAAKKVRRRVGETQRFGVGTTTTFALGDARFDEVHENTAATMAVIALAALGVILLIAVATYEPPPPPPPPEPKPK